MANKELQYQEDEIDLKQLFRSLADRKWFIFGFTGLVTILAIAYALSIPPTYQASISFVSPSQSSVLQLNKIKLISETSETIYHLFLSKVMSSEFQRKVFDNNDYLAQLNPKNKPIKNLDNFVNGFTKSVMLSSVSDKKNEKSSYEKPIEISLEGGNPNIISSFLNDLANTANKETVDELLSVIQQKIDIHLEQIDSKISLLHHLKERERNNKITELSYALEMATKLGIKDNNFKDLTTYSNTSLIINISNSQSLPTWYLFGTDALTKEIDLIRKDEYNFIPEIAKLEVEKIKLNSFKLSPVGINAMQLNQRSTPPESPIKPKKRLIIAVAFIAGFMLSIFLVFIMNAFKKPEDEKATA